jgi:DNA-binding GntR family transcriptional regulator
MQKTDSWRNDSVRQHRSLKIEARESSSTLAYERLRQAIIRGEFQPGERLTEVTTAGMLGVSRTPVREAFARLTMDGLMRAAETGGMEVVDPQQELADIYHIREAVEGCAARLAAMRGSAAELDQILALASASRRTDRVDVKTRAKLNDEFHMAVAKAGHAPRVERLVSDYRELFATPRVLRRYTVEETETAIGDHEAIARAIHARDGDSAERAVRDHLRRAYAVLLKLEQSPAPANDIAAKVVRPSRSRQPKATPGRRK